MSSQSVAGDARRIKTLLLKSTAKKLSFSELLREFDRQDDPSYWDAKRIQRAHDYMQDHPQTYSGIKLIRGGKAFTITTNERVAKGAGVYRDIANVLEGHSKQVQAIFNPSGSAPVRIVHDVHAGRTGNGGWSRPDVILLVKTKEALTRAKEIHAFELELSGKSSPSNVAQAWMAGQGADFCWLLFDRKDRPTTKAARSADHHWLATEKMAKKLGVGLISFGELSNGNTWRVELGPQKQRRDQNDRRQLLSLIVD